MLLFKLVIFRNIYQNMITEEHREVILQTKIQGI